MSPVKFNLQLDIGNNNNENNRENNNNKYSNQRHLTVNNNNNNNNMLDQSYRVDDECNIFIHPKLSLHITSNGIQNNTNQIKSAINDFNILNVLGSGASSTVYKAIHKQSQLIVAIKQLNIFDSNARHQLYQELIALHTLQNNNNNSNQSTFLTNNNTLFVQFYGCYYKQSQFSLILEYMNIGSIDTILTKLNNECITDEYIISYICRCIIYSLYILRQSHQLHRDIKPQNILVNSTGYVKLSDFGLARQLIDNSIQQQANTYVGTLIYMSPERITGQKYSYSSDIWSTGLIAYLLTTGQHPYTTVNGKSLGQIELIQSIVHDKEPRLDNSVYSDELCDFVSTCIIKEPKQRATAEQLLQHNFITKYNHINENNFVQWLQQNNIYSGE